MDYNLTSLGPREFEHLVQALCIKTMGVGVTVFGDGPDGGREATFGGPISWSRHSDSTEWSGYTVVQAKFRERPRDPTDNLHWLQGEIAKEVVRWTDERFKRHKTKKPTNLLVVTNVVLSAASGGGHDKIHAELKRLSEKHGLHLSDSTVWHYDQLCSLLDTEPEIRATYGGYITTGDVLGRMAAALGLDANADLDRLGEALRTDAVKDLLAQQWVRLGQAGDPEDDRVALGQVAIDLPALLNGPVDSEADRNHNTLLAAAALIVGRGERVLNHGLHSDQPQHLLVVGSAGQGKSTLGQLVCQAYRVALLNETGSAGAEAERLLQGLRTDLARIGVPIPGHRRWPVRIDLSDYGDAVAGGEAVSLLRFIANRISGRTPEPVTPAQLHSWLGHWPWLLVLDGLDEIATPSVRERVTSAVSEFLVDAANRSADVLIVVTTRPQGYAGEFGAQDYQRLDLLPLDADKAVECAARLGEQRIPDDEEFRRRVLERMTTAAHERETSRLLKTPLQVAIMQLLLERRQRAPHDRYQLFDVYFDAIYSREQNKPGWVGRLLEDYRPDIVTIHEQLALRLQQQAEHQGQHEASVPTAVLDEITRGRLEFQGHSNTEAAGLAKKLVDAATQRLVLLVPVLDSDVGFEVRSLREFLAARAVTTGPDDDVLTRLTPLVPSAHWRNTWLFAAGRVFLDREHLRASIISLLREFDNRTLLSMLACPGAELATDLLDDDLAIRAPQFRRTLAEHAIDRVSMLPDGAWRELANTLFTAAESDPMIRARLDRQIELARGAGEGPAATANVLLTMWGGQVGALAAHARQLLGGENHHLGERTLLRTPSSNETYAGPALTKFVTPFRPEIADKADRQALDELLTALNGIRLLRCREGARDDGHQPAYVADTEPPDMAVLDRTLGRPAVADAFAQLIDAIPPPSYQVASALKDVARYWFGRRRTTAAAG